VTSAFEILFSLLAVLALVAVPLYAQRVRGRTYATFSGVNLLLSLPGAWVLAFRLVERAPAWLEPLVGLAFVWGLTAGALHLAHLVRARLRGRFFRLFVSIPGQVFVASGFMSGLVMLALLPVRAALVWFDQARLLGWLEVVEALPLVLAAFSVATSLRPAREWVRVHLASGGAGEFCRVPVERSRRAPTGPQGLRIVQITDPHLGPWQSVKSLQRLLGSLLEEDPDLVLLTGDFLTMEGRGSPGSLAKALQPLRLWNEERRERGAGQACFAIFGNHDHEDPEEVSSALRHAGARLLIDEEESVETRCGPVQILGANHVFRGVEEHVEGLLRDHPRSPGHLRLLLLHDPAGFRHVPDGSVDLTLSGHTHGGQVGLVSFGLDWTVLSRTRWPDHGLFAQGSNHLYVHRGTGFYGFPLRVGVPGELSVLELLVPSA
jgi:predicted MPP superfamily phosphohydrolase